MASPRKSAKTVAPVATPEPVQFAYSLESVIEATLNSGFVYTSPAFHTALVESGDVEVNVSLVNENGEFATRATAKHLPQSPQPENESIPMTETATQTPAPVAAIAAPTPRVFEIKSGAIPEVTRKSGGLRAGRTAVYPFDKLEVGQYFFVANSGEKTAFKSLASTVSGANHRFAVPVEGQYRINRKGVSVPVTVQDRKFKAFDTTDTINGAEVAGAKVFRMPLETAVE